MFHSTVFLIVTLQQHDESVVSLIEAHGGSAIVKSISDTSHQLAKVHHVIARLVDFVEYADAKRQMIPVTTPEWVAELIRLGKAANYKAFNPDPRFFMKEVFLCIADNLPEGDKEVMYGGVRAFGGQYLDDLTRYTTHLVAVDVTNIKSIVASSAVIKTPAGVDTDIKIVLPQWVDDCLKQGKKVDESRYLLSNPQVAATGRPAKQAHDQISPKVLGDDLPRDVHKARTTHFVGKTIYLASDYMVSERLGRCIHSLIELNGAVVASHFDSSVDIYLGKYRDGDAYVHACHNKVVVGNLAWFYQTLISDEWVLPHNSSLLHYPVPRHPLEAFKKMKVSVTNYSGDARFYLLKLISLLGATFTKTLTKENDVLVAAKPEGKKYDTATQKWLENGVPIVNVVNHLWLEECFASWSFKDPREDKYRYIDPEGLESMLGRTRLEVASILPESGNVDDSMSDDELARGIAPGQPPGQPPFGPEGPEGEEREKTERLQGEETIQRAPLEEHSSSGANEADDTTHLGKSVTVEPETGATLVEPETASLNRALAPPEQKSKTPSLSPAPIVVSSSPAPRGRSAKAKAAAKLHENMEDLNNFTSKSKTKRDSYLEQFEEEPPKKKKPSAAPHIIAIMTGCELTVGLSRVDVVNLAHAGIKIVSDYLPRHNIDTIIAPRILRTEKFLKSLSVCKRIVHPSYIVLVLPRAPSTSWEDLLKEYNIDDYALDKVLPARELASDLGHPNGLEPLLVSPRKGTLFSNIKLNLLVKLNGGPDLIHSILEAHGLHHGKPFKSASASAIKQLLSTDTTVCVVHKTKDASLIPPLKKAGIVVVEWDWCVKSIFAMALQSYEDFSL